MAKKPFQFRLASLVWLVVGSALVFGVVRFATSGGLGRTEWQVRANVSRILKTIGVPSRLSDDAAVAIIVSTIVSLPLLFLFLRRRFTALDRAARRRAREPYQCDPAAPLRERLHKFLSNVARVESPAEPPEPSVVLPVSLEGKPARTRREVAEPLGRIRDAAAEMATRDEM